MVSVMAAHRLSQILEIRQLAAGGGIRKIRRELVQLGSGSRVSAGLGGLGGALQVGGDFLCDLRIFRGIRLLKLLERAGQLRERRELAAIGLLDGCESGGGGSTRGRVVRKEIDGQDCVEQSTGEISYGTHAV